MREINHKSMGIVFLLNQTLFMLGNSGGGGQLKEVVV